MQHIICTTKEIVENAFTGDGFIKTQDNIFDLNHFWVGPRPHLEGDENFKQIIPYVVLSYQGKIALYKRTKKGGENRLHDMHSIGFGGHIDAFDLIYDADGTINIGLTIEKSARREIDEELVVSSIASKTTLGYITDNSNPVGRVHIGVVEQWELTEPEVKSNEDEIEVVGLFSIDELQSFDGEIENWSTHIINGL